MIASTLYGQIPVDLKPVDGLSTSGKRADICTLRGEVLGQTINSRLMLDLETGEILLSSPDNFVGAFRLGDLIINHIAAQIGRAQVEQLNKAVEGGHAKAH